MKKLTAITAGVFDNYLIISLHIDWIKVFGGIPQFDVLIHNDGRLCIVSKSVIKK